MVVSGLLCSLLVDGNMTADESHNNTQNSDERNYESEADGATEMRKQRMTKDAKVTYVGQLRVRAAPGARDGRQLNNIFMDVYIQNVSRKGIQHNEGRRSLTENHLLPLLLVVVVSCRWNTLLLVLPSSLLSLLATNCAPNPHPTCLRVPLL